jgi:hypothetical protein
MKKHFLILTFLFMLPGMFNKAAAQTLGPLMPPYNNAIYIDSNIIKSTDSSTFYKMIYVGQHMENVYDNRINGWATVNAYIFEIRMNDGRVAQAIVNPEFENVTNASLEAMKYGFILGQLPKCVRMKVTRMWIHKGTQPIVGKIGSDAIIIHTGQAAIYETQGVLEEVLLQKAAFLSLNYLSEKSGWIAAVGWDLKYISLIAVLNPATEDVAESFLAWFATKRCSRISTNDHNRITFRIPHRITYFNNQNFNLNPVCTP